MEQTINKVEIQGFLGKDAEVRTFDSGRTKVSLSLATNESYKNNQGEWVKSTTWHNVTYWKNKKDEEIVILKKGDMVFVSGKLNNRRYTDKSGQDRFITEVVASKIEPVKEEVNG